MTERKPPERPDVLVEKPFEPRMEDIDVMNARILAFEAEETHLHEAAERYEVRTRLAMAKTQERIGHASPEVQEQIAAACEALEASITREWESYRAQVQSHAEYRRAYELLIAALKSESGEH